MKEKSAIAHLFERLGFEQKLIDEIMITGRQATIKSDAIVIRPEGIVSEIPFVLSGLLMVMRKDQNGNELFLYNLESGETCAMSITCCLEGKKNSFFVIAEEKTEMWLIPTSMMDEWIKKYDSFRKFVFSSYQTRFNELLMAIDSIAFTKMDKRLLKYLLDKKQATGSFIINKTHQQIANDLNTSRVVVSRLLKQLENEDKIEQSRNRIEIL